MLADCSVKVYHHRKESLSSDRRQQLARIRDDLARGGGRYKSLTVFVLMKRKGRAKPAGRGDNGPRDEAAIVCEQILKPLGYNEGPSILFVQVMPVSH